MPNTIYAAFATEHDAERAAGALLDSGVAVQDISFIVPGGPAPARSEMTAEQRAAAEARVGGAPMPTSAPPARPPADIPAPDVPEISAPQPVNRVAGVDGHPVFERDGMQTSPGYTFDTVNNVIPDPEQGAMRVETPAAQVIAPSATMPAVPSNAPMDVVEHEPRPHIVDQNRVEPTAARGISTTTAGDAAKGALEGAGIGLGLGALLGLATVAIPGVGLVAGAGALVAGLAAATGAAGAVAGGTYGYLHEMGLSPETARRLSANLEAGGPVLSINVSGAVPSGEILRLLQKYGATSAEMF
ncbi:MAG TPA: hypothetical protein VKT32_10955 [Chthonomonadaceae bacterium]|nr:hypothetical protein [Chthonomonadaceae bacterium]